MAGDWAKGGLRYKRLKRKVPERLAPESMRAFFIALKGSRGGGSGLRALAKREFVIAVTDAHLYVISLKGPGVFSSTLDEVVQKLPLDGASVEWVGKSLRVGGVEYRPFAYHDEDARTVAHLAQQ